MKHLLKLSSLLAVLAAMSACAGQKALSGPQETQSVAASRPDCEEPGKGLNHFKRARRIGTTSCDAGR